MIPTARELLDRVCRRYHIHARRTELEAHEWVYEGLLSSLLGITWMLSHGDSCAFVAAVAGLFVSVGTMHWLFLLLLLLNAAHFHKHDVQDIHTKLDVVYSSPPCRISLQSQQ